MSTFMLKLLSLPGIVIAFSLHEYGHAIVSNKLGDPTPKRQGRLTINPLAHMDIFGFVCLLLCGFGWGKPVQINPYNYKNRRAGEIMVSLAGVGMNLILAILFSFPTKWLYGLMVTNSSVMLENIFYIFYFIVQINLCLMIFNLIPIPPLDGWNLLSQVCNLEKYSWYPFVYKNSFYILLALVFLNVPDLILMPGVSFFMDLLL